MANIHDVFECQIVNGAFASFTVRLPIKGFLEAFELIYASVARMTGQAGVVSENRIRVL